MVLSKPLGTPEMAGPESRFIGIPTGISHLTAIERIVPWLVGGIVMMGRFFATRDPTSEVRFSLDQGSCWHSVRLSEALHIENIRQVCISLAHDST